ncbi:unnamed protein product [Chrysoparadoxa australica]
MRWITLLLLSLALPELCLALPQLSRSCPLERPSRPSTWLLGVRGGGRDLGPQTDLRNPASSSAALPPITKPPRGDDEVIKEDAAFAAEFLVRDRRLGFVRKVYTTLSCQLAITGAVILFMGKHKAPIMNAMLPVGPDGVMQTGRYMAASLGSLGVSIACLMTLAGNKKLRQTFPSNMAMLGLFTLVQSFSVGLFTLFYSARSVAMAAFQTVFATLGLTLYAFQTNPKYDLTGTGSMLSSTLMILVGFGLMRLFFPLVPLLETIYAAAGALLMSLFIVYDTYRVLGGKHRSQDQIESKDYVMGAATLYIDIIELFIHLLRLFGQSEGS